MEVTKEIRLACKELGFHVEKYESHRLDSAAKSLGYEPLGYSNTYDDKSEGIIVALPEGKNRFNNGVYMMHQTSNGQILLEVIQASTADKSQLIKHLIGQITTFVENQDTSDLDVYDFAEIYGFVIANTVIKHLAVSLYPMDVENQKHFTMLYLSRFLAHVAQIHAGDPDIREEAVNSDPYMFKMAIDGIPLLDEQLKVQAEEAMAAHEANDDV